MLEYTKKKGFLSHVIFPVTLLSGRKSSIHVKRFVGLHNMTN